LPLEHDFVHDDGNGDDDDSKVDPIFSMGRRPRPRSTSQSELIEACWAGIELGVHLLQKVGFCGLENMFTFSALVFDGLE